MHRVVYSPGSLSASFCFCCTVKSTLTSLKLLPALLISQWELHGAVTRLARQYISRMWFGGEKYVFIKYPGGNISTSSCPNSLQHQCQRPNCCLDYTNLPSHPPKRKTCNYTIYTAALSSLTGRHVNTCTLCFPSPSQENERLSVFVSVTLMKRNTNSFHCTLGL